MGIRYSITPTLLSTCPVHLYGTVGRLGKRHSNGAGSEMSPESVPTPLAGASQVLCPCVDPMATCGYLYLRFAPHISCLRVHAGRHPLGAPRLRVDLTYKPALGVPIRVRLVHPRRERGVPESGSRRRSSALGGPWKGWPVTSMRLGPLRRIHGGDSPVAVAGRAVGRCRGRGRPPSQLA